MPRTYKETLNGDIHLCQYQEHSEDEMSMRDQETREQIDAIRDLISEELQTKMRTQGIDEMSRMSTSILETIREHGKRLVATLNEEQGISYVFDGPVDDAMNLVRKIASIEDDEKRKKYYNKLLYLDWTYDVNDDQCYKNDEQRYDKADSFAFDIAFIIVDYDFMHVTYQYTMNMYRSMQMATIGYVEGYTDSIVVLVMDHLIDSLSHNEIDERKVYDLFMHEFVHARASYHSLGRFKPGLTPDSIEIERRDLIELSEDERRTIRENVYLLAPGEIQARLTQTYSKMISFSRERLENCLASIKARHVKMSRTDILKKALYELDLDTEFQITGLKEMIRKMYLSSDIDSAFVIFKIAYYASKNGFLKARDEVVNLSREEFKKKGSVIDNKILDKCIRSLEDKIEEIEYRPLWKLYDVMMEKGLPIPIEGFK